MLIFAKPFSFLIEILAKLLPLFCLVIEAQVLNRDFGNQGGSSFGRRGAPYPDYYDQHPQRYRPWNPGQDHIKFLETGIKSNYGDKRCIAEGNYNESLKGSVTVDTRLGKVEGTYVYLCDAPGVSEYDRPKKPDSRYPYHRPVKIHKSLAIFLGIPYAKPPTSENDLRFKPPQFLQSFNLIRALQYKDACPQDVKYYGWDKGVPTTSEDCLYLNIFTPSVEKVNEKYPVMIYIHGGSWDHGSANVFPAHMLSASQEVVVVTFNYRLGPLGFLAMGDNSSAGNFGLLDQVMAIEWVMDNIDAFNGNPNLITLFGPGSGAASAGMHIFNNRLGERHGILRIIAQSGAAVADWASSSDPSVLYNNSMEFARLMRCDFGSTWRTVECLRNVDIVRFQISDLQLKNKLGWLPWMPAVDAHTREPDKQILPASPEVLLKISDNLYLDGYLAGVTKDDGLPLDLIDRPIPTFNYQSVKNMFLNRIYHFPAMYNYTLDPEALIKALQFFYVPCDEKPENVTLLLQNFVDMLSDSYFNAPNDKMMKLLMERGIKTYMYVLNTTAEGIQKIHSRGILNMSVPHDSEYYFITGAPFMDPNLYPKKLQLDIVEWTEADRNMSQFFMTAFANFAKFGNPTPSVLMESILWNKTDLKHMHYLLVNTTNFTSVLLSGYRQKESQFWNEYIPGLMQLVMPTWPLELQPWEAQRNIYVASFWGVLGATVLFISLSFICCCLYCRAKSKHVVSTEDIPDAVSTAPSSIDTLLSMKKLERSRYIPQKTEVEQKHTQV